MHGGIVGVCDIDCDADRDLAALYGTKKPVLAIFKKADDATDIFERELRFTGDFSLAVAAPLQSLDISEQIDRPVLAPGQVLDEAHHQTVFAAGVDDERWNLLLHFTLERRTRPFTLFLEQRTDGLFEVIRAVGDTSFGPIVLLLRD